MVVVIIALFCRLAMLLLLDYLATMEGGLSGRIKYVKCRIIFNGYVDIDTQIVKCLNR
jgi:hypothetical protein